MLTWFQVSVGTKQVIKRHLVGDVVMHKFHHVRWKATKRSANQQGIKDISVSCVPIIRRNCFESVMNLQRSQNVEKIVHLVSQLVRQHQFNLGGVTGHRLRLCSFPLLCYAITFSDLSQVTGISVKNETPVDFTRLHL